MENNAEDKAAVTGMATVFHFHTDLVGTPLEATDEAAQQYAKWLDSL